MSLYQMIKKIWPYRRNILISFVFIGIIVLPESKYFHEWALAGIAGALLVSLVGLLKAGQSDHKETTLPDAFLILLTSLICTTLFWYRAWTNLPSDFLIEPIFDMITGFGFWWPGILYASLYRHSGESWPPASRSRYLQFLGLGLGGSLIGITLAYAL
jgi:hypothetical protein